MSQFFEIHPETPQARLLARAVTILREDGVIVYPTDSAYAIACRLENKRGAERVRRIRDIGKDHNFTLVCRDLSELATYARVDNTSFRLIKRHTPGPYTFILMATREVPRRLAHPKRRTIGLRVPGNRIARGLLDELGEPLMSSTLILDGEDPPLTDPHEIRERLEHQVDLVIDGGFCGAEPTTVVDLTEGLPHVTRRGRGDSSDFAPEATRTKS